MIRAGVLAVGGSWSASATHKLPSAGNAAAECTCPSGDICLGLIPPPRSLSLRLSADPRRTPAHVRLHKIVVRAQQSDEVEEILNEIDKKDIDDTPLRQDATVDGSKSSQTGDSQAFFEDVQADSQIILDSVDEAAEGKGGVSRETAQSRIVETAKDGIEVLKWAAEGVVNAGLNAKGGLGAAKELLDKRLKSFSVAVDETKGVSSQVAEVAQKKFGELQGSASKFSEEFQVNVEEKKAADSLKPESEVNPLAKAEQVVGENVAKATAKDGPVTKVTETLASGWEKVSKAGEDLVSAVGKVGEDISGRAKEVTKGTEEKIDEASKESGST